MVVAVKLPIDFGVDGLNYATFVAFQLHHLVDGGWL